MRQAAKAALTLAAAVSTAAVLAGQTFSDPRDANDELAGTPATAGRLTGGTRWLGARVGRSADYLSMAQFDLLSWVLGGCKDGSTRGPPTVFLHVPCIIAA